MFTTLAEYFNWLLSRTEDFTNSEKKVVLLKLHFQSVEQDSCKKLFLMLTFKVLQTALTRSVLNYNCTTDTFFHADSRKLAIKTVAFMLGIFLYETRRKEDKHLINFHKTEPTLCRSLSNMQQSAIITRAAGRLC